MKLRGLMVASAALALLAAAPVAFSAEGDGGGKVKCQGINSCAGKGDCAAVDGSHDCGGQNGCKGKGWVEVESAKVCTEKGGTVLK
jgi:uncharacterized membrane protein